MRKQSKEDRDDEIYCLASDHNNLLIASRILSEVMTVREHVKDALAIVERASKEVNDKLNKVRGK